MIEKTESQVETEVNKNCKVVKLFEETKDKFLKKGVVEIVWEFHIYFFFFQAYQINPYLYHISAKNGRVTKIEKYEQNGKEEQMH